jgi:hypothetical protein
MAGILFLASGAQRTFLSSVVFCAAIDPAVSVRIYFFIKSIFFCTPQFSLRCTSMSGYQDLSALPAYKFK